MIKPSEFSWTAVEPSPENKVKSLLDQLTAVRRLLDQMTPTKTQVATSTLLELAQRLIENESTNSTETDANTDNRANIRATLEHVARTLSSDEMGQ
jgi:hypothetical protein